ncbi:MADS-box MEF2 type transcription factor MIG1 [Drosophila willistoni]|uniref:MADS-box MEF2 type transcription factor MIG1 n=1 Tax=Drosophila willistoni TaxID=7260 RepID=UPI00017D6B8F|nr:MADS-box MEF2 type transcription factor MIG1 [Drosophila willistoni]
MNLLMDNLPIQGNPAATGRRPTPPRQADLRISTASPQHQHQQQHPHQQQHATHQQHLSNNNNNNEKQISPPKTSMKRSFDVAFLMMPDERIKQKQAEKQARLEEALQMQQQHMQLQQQQQQQQQQQLNHYPTDLSPRGNASQIHNSSPPAMEYISLMEARQRYPQLSIRSPRIYDDPTLVLPVGGESSPEAVSTAASSPPPLPLRSAFTKVASSSVSTSSSSPSNTSRLESPSIIEPDQLSCHSMSPPLETPPPAMPTSAAAAAAPPSPLVYHNFRPEYQFNGAFQAVNSMQALRLKQLYTTRPPGPNCTPISPPSSSPPSSVASGGPPPEFLHAAAAYPGFAPPPHPFAVAQPLQNPAAAAILSTLIPPTLASTFTLTAQNVCAKCNISFRMTSDLVYHMRSHHKSEVACDPNRRKREEKLRCPVCQETFRERHHLTRHMTAHQDKASDHQPNNNSAAPGDHHSSSSASSSSSSSASSSSSSMVMTDSGDNEIINVVSGSPGRRGSNLHK